ncbi:MAG: hypothetical protein ACXWXM_07975 [Actinomycetota bacterium]
MRVSRRARVRRRGPPAHGDPWSEVSLDEAAAKDEAEIALSHLARGRLLEAGVFPLSRPELDAQSRGIGEDVLARALSSTETAASELVDVLEELLPCD